MSNETGDGNSAREVDQMEARVARRLREIDDTDPVAVDDPPAFAVERGARTFRQQLRCVVCTRCRPCASRRGERETGAGEG